MTFSYMTIRLTCLLARWVGSPHIVTQLLQVLQRVVHHVQCVLVDVKI